MCCPVTCRLGEHRPQTSCRESPVWDCSCHPLSGPRTCNPSQSLARVRVRSPACVMRVHFAILGMQADRAAIPMEQAGLAMSVCFRLCSVCIISLVISTHFAPRYPTRCLSTCATVLRCGAVIVDDRTGLPLVTWSANEKQKTFAPRSLFYPQSTEIRHLLLPQVRPVAVGCVFCVLHLSWVSEHHRVSRFQQPADASQHLVWTKSFAHREVGPPRRAMVTDDSNVSQH